MIRISKPGLLTTVQDLGRPGFQQYGIVVGGALDGFAARCVNLCVGNDDNAALLEGLRNAGYLRIYGWIGVGILLVTLLLTLFDRHFDPQFPRRWRDGLAESFYAAVKIATAGQVPGRTNRLGWLGRVWQGVWLLPAIALVAFVTSSVTSVLTTQSLHHQINSLQDVKDQPVGVLAGTGEEDYGRTQGLTLRSYDDLDPIGIDGCVKMAFPALNFCTSSQV